MEANLVINDHIVIPGSELNISVSRASGPGGQHVNKTSSRVSLRWNIVSSIALTAKERALVIERLHTRIVGEGELLINVESERSQRQNREIARQRLAKLLRQALRPKKRRVATKPTLNSQIRRLYDKRKRGTVKKLRKFKDNDGADN